MNVPDSTSGVWGDLILGNSTPDLEFLALKILLARLRLEVKMHPGVDQLQKCSEEIRSLLVKNMHIPKVQKDLKSIIGAGGE